MRITRRELVVGTAAFAATALPRRTAPAQETEGPFKLDPLPYPPNALAPYIDARTMEIHHDVHHRAYVFGLNGAVKDHANVAAMPLQDILSRLSEMPEGIRTALRNFGGGHANHFMFWQVMGSQAMGRQVKGSRPSGTQEKGTHGAAPTGELAKDVLQRHRRHRRVVLHGLVEAVHIRAVMEVVMNLHRPCIDIRGERIGRIGQGVEPEGTRDLLRPRRNPGGSKRRRADDKVATGDGHVLLLA